MKTGDQILVACLVMFFAVYAFAWGYFIRAFVRCAEHSYRRSFLPSFRVVARRKLR